MIPNSKLLSTNNQKNVLINKITDKIAPSKPLCLEELIEVFPSVIKWILEIALIDYQYDREPINAIPAVLTVL